MISENTENVQNDVHFGANTKEICKNIWQLSTSSLYGNKSKHYAICPHIFWTHVIKDIILKSKKQEISDLESWEQMHSLVIF